MAVNCDFLGLIRKFKRNEYHKKNRLSLILIFACRKKNRFYEYYERNSALNLGDNPI